MTMRIDRRRFMGVAGFGALALATASLAAPKAPRVVKIVAKRFTYSPSVVKLKKGEPVVFELTTLDVPMGLNIPDFKVRSDIIPGKTTKLAFTPDKTGTFTFVCDLFCGDGHEGMEGKIVVT